MKPSQVSITILSGGLILKISETAVHDSWWRVILENVIDNYYYSAWRAILKASEVSGTILGGGWFLKTSETSITILSGRLLEITLKISGDILSGRGI